MNIEHTIHVDNVVQYDAINYHHIMIIYKHCNTVSNNVNIVTVSDCFIKSLIKSFVKSSAKSSKNF